MIIVQDRIAVAATDLPKLRTLLERQYLPDARARGLVPLDSGVSPPLTFGCCCASAGPPMPSAAQIASSRITFLPPLDRRQV